VLGTIDNGRKWQWAAFGKHPTAKDFFRLGEKTPFFDGLFRWVEDGYQLLTAKENSLPDFCSWRFWAREAGKGTLVCGVIRVSSDSFGRPYPLVITGSGLLDSWQDNRDLLPFACEKTWGQIEYLASNLFPDLKRLEEEIRTIRPPDTDWQGLRAKRKALNEIGSRHDPYASFPDLGELRKLAAANGEKGEVFVSLDRGPCNDKIMRVSLWHLLFSESSAEVPNALFMGGTLEKAYLALFRRPLKSADFTRLWSVSAAGLWKNLIGTEHSMDLSELGTQPISSDKPAGRDIRYEPSFDELQTEVDKLSSPSLAGSVNWDRVCRLASDILISKSKDLLVTSYLAVALIHTRGSDGFALGLKILSDLVERFWADLYPPRIRMRGRVRAVEWWLEKAETALRQAKEISFPADQIVRIRENLNRLDIFLGEHLENSPPLNPVREYFQSLSPAEEEIPSTDALVGPVPKDDDGAPTGGENTSSEQPEPGGPIRVISSRQEADAVLGDGLQRIREASFFLWQQDPADPQVYRLTRKAAWHNVEELPPSTEGRTRILPPTPLEKNLLFDLRNTGDAEALLKAVEARLTQYIFWIDLNRLAAEALSRLGSRYERAQTAVCQETAFLLHRLPGIEDLSFSDGTPFATPETRQWLQGIVFRKDPPGIDAAASSSPGGTSDMESAIERGIDEMLTLVRRGKLIEAMEAGQRRLRDGGSRREVLLWRLALARMFVGVGKTKLALPYLEQVLEDIESHRLEEYDPSLALRGFRLAWLAFDTQVEKRFKEQATAILHRIGRLDMAEMVRLAKE
jgi:type VI secretion system protein VasJ